MMIWYRATILAALLLLLLALSVVAFRAPANAGLDDELSLIDEQGRNMQIAQWDTFLNGVSPLDRNRFTREWFHTGRASYEITGPDADRFDGKLELGYQVEYPWATGIRLNFAYTTPNTSVLYGVPNALPNGRPKKSFALTPKSLLPTAGITIDTTNGPGVQEIATISAPVKGAAGSVAVSNAHGTVTGAAGGVLLRPYARLISTTGESVTTYGRDWNMG
ncbi:MspA family porin [Mycobacteroides immunogenum]|nr:MspA family porin [Mycobacteroides immunogenum]